MAVAAVRLRLLIFMTCASPMHTVQVLSAIDEVLPHPYKQLVVSTRGTGLSTAMAQSLKIRLEEFCAATVLLPQLDEEDQQRIRIATVRGLLLSLHRRRGRRVYVDDCVCVLRWIVGVPPHGANV
jgi:hypothetical protein